VISRGGRVTASCCWAVVQRRTRVIEFGTYRLLLTSLVSVSGRTDGESDERVSCVYVVFRALCVWAALVP
jgi:hypothetical protein